ncbi:hypothetical protein PMAYCL1PPCAC_27251 [Pristionchus mayeri]|uniref:DUF7622 domain-containing protein n=1 Tax=Pristionchus mayeri TaxID=1317129 RepID=A0AAN5D620_9BILA|nr:hypothetical protein PMAYCL1PPCAC_27251 [Pristionchus mayeri]
MRRLLSLTVVLCLLSDTFAIVCRDHRSGNITRTCTGDYCWNAMSNGARTPLTNENGDALILEHQGCLTGKAVDYINRRCWFAEHLHMFYYCVCDSDFCNDEVQPVPAQGNLTCGNETLDQSWVKNCVACSIESMNGEEMPSRCVYQELYSVEDILQPTSCARIDYETHSLVRCLCDTGDNCVDKLHSEQVLKSDAVTCYLGEKDNSTCQGNRCFVQRENTRVAYRGCITNNETLFPGQFPNGYMNLMRFESIICNTSYCNLNWLSASESVAEVANKTTRYPFLSVTTEMSAPRKQFEIEYMKLFTSIKSAIDNFIAKFTELCG